MQSKHTSVVQFEPESASLGVLPDTLQSSTHLSADCHVVPEKSYVKPFFLIFLFLICVIGVDFRMYHIFQVICNDSSFLTCFGVTYSPGDGVVELSLNVIRRGGGAGGGESVVRSGQSTDATDGPVVSVASITSLITHSV